jgi:uncharacterized protein with FMN-binding domain
MALMTSHTRFAAMLLSTVGFAAAAQAAQLNTPVVDATVMPDASVQLAASTSVLHDGSFIGGTYDAYYGVVQVQATISGGQIVNVKALKFPNHSGTSRSINRQALPYLLQEVVAKQSARVATISGASLTSNAYRKSLRDALQQSAK